MHVTLFEGRISSLESISVDMVNGSGVDPSAFIVDASDLHHENIMVKYLIIGASQRHMIGEPQLRNVSFWASINNFRLNQAQSRELLVARRGCADPPPALTPGFERVTSMKILGVIISEDLRASIHVRWVLETSLGSLYALRILRAEGLPETARGMTDVRLMYAAPAWWEYAAAENRVRLERFLFRVHRMGSPV